MERKMADMRRYFNTEAQCEPEEHYMVRLDDRLEKIRRMFVDRGKYFVINRGRQYGKTTTLCALAEYLKPDYTVIFMDFQGIGKAEFENETTFSAAFRKLFLRALEKVETDAESTREIVNLKEADDMNMTLMELFHWMSGICAAAVKPVVLMIDEVDSASNNQIFVDFLAMLRGCYIARRDTPTFHSVILAGVYDIKNLKLKMRPDEEHQYNSPWNIAAEFNVDMSFSVSQIEGMLREYEEDNHTGMDTAAVAEEIYRYTSGYPYLVSVICKILDEELPEKEEYAGGRCAWTKEGISEAVKVLLNKKLPLFDSMVKQLDIYKELRTMIEEILYQGRQISFSPYVKSVSLGVMFGFIKEENGYIALSNRIFEMGLLNMFITEEAVGSEVFSCGQRDRNRFIKGAKLDMDMVLEKFVMHFHDIYSDNDTSFIEKYGRKFFLLYLKPIINGTGNYYIEARTRDERRTDVVVDYLGKQFVVELKIWHGNEYNERGESQLSDYLEYFHLDKGYMLSFNFNKKKEIGIKQIVLGKKTIIEAVV